MSCFDYEILVNSHRFLWNWTLFLLLGTQVLQGNAFRCKLKKHQSISHY